MATNQDEFRERLGTEVEAWERERLITAEQAHAILARYGLRASAARAVRLGPVATFLAIVGAIVLGIGVVYFFAANWEVLPVWFKVTLVFSGTAAAYAAGYWVQFLWGGLPRVGAGLILLGAILYQTGIFLLAQIYHMPVDSPIALLLGAAGILPLAYATGSRLVLAFSLVDGLAWLVWELLRRYPNFPEALVAWLTFILAGVVVFAASHWHHLRRDTPRFAPVYEMLGLVAVLLPVYVLSFGNLWEEAQRRDIADFSVPRWFAGVVVLAVLAAGSLLLGRPGDPVARAQTGVFAAIALIVALVALLPGGAGGYALLFNLVYFGLALLACVYGYLEGQARFVNLGIPVLALGLITRYVDLFWDLLPRSAFYIAGGIVLLGVAAGLERLRQRLLSGPGAAGGTDMAGAGV